MTEEAHAIRGYVNFTYKKLFLVVVIKRKSYHRETFAQFDLTDYLKRYELHTRLPQSKQCMNFQLPFDFLALKLV